MSFNISGKAFIKVYRKLLEWEWYTDTNTKTLFLHCLLKANWKPGNWRGISYNAGEFITSLPVMAEETGLTVQQVRTALNKLKSTGEITDRATDGNHSRGRVITVSNWEIYQDDNRPTNRPVNRIATGYQQDSNRIATAEEEYIKNNKESKENKRTVHTAPAAAEPPAESFSSLAYLSRGENEPDPGEITNFLVENCPHVFASEFIQHCRKNKWQGDCEDWQALANRWESYRARKGGIN